MTSAPHGSRTRYNHGPCRCDRCRAAHRRYMRGRYARRKKARTGHSVRSYTRRPLP